MQVLNRIEGKVSGIYPEMITTGYQIDYKGNKDAVNSHSIPSGQKKLHFQGMATAVAIGYGEASKPNIDRNDDEGIWTSIVQIAGQTSTMSLLHCGLDTGTRNDGRITADFYTCKNIRIDAEKEALLDNLACDNIHQVDIIE